MRDSLLPARNKSDLPITDREIFIRIIRSISVHSGGRLHDT